MQFSCHRAQDGLIWAIKLLTVFDLGKFLPKKMLVFTTKNYRLTHSVLTLRRKAAKFF